MPGSIFRQTSKIVSDVSVFKVVLTQRFVFDV